MKRDDSTGFEPIQQATEDHIPFSGRNMLQNDKRMNKAVKSMIGELIHHGAKENSRFDKANILDSHTLCVGAGFHQHRNRNINTIDMSESRLRSQGQGKPAYTTAKIKCTPSPNWANQRLYPSKILQYMLTARIKEIASLFISDDTGSKGFISKDTIVRILGTKSLPCIICIADKKGHGSNLQQNNRINNEAIASIEAR